MWKSTVECNYPTVEEIVSICHVNNMFKWLVQQVRESFEDLDNGCPHVHPLRSPPVYPSDDNDDEEQEPPRHPVVPSYSNGWGSHPPTQWVSVVSSFESSGCQLSTINFVEIKMLYLARNYF